jgi:hypothetical protein
MVKRSKVIKLKLSYNKWNYSKLKLTNVKALPLQRE